MRSEEFVVLVPVKSLSRAKSRLVGISPGRRRQLAEAFVRDTVAAAVATPGVRTVLVVTDDVELARSLVGERCQVVPDGVADDLNGSLVQAAAEAGRRWPGVRPVALCSDLPALTPTALAAALARVGVVAPDGPAFVPDAAGLGTTLYSAPPALFTPSFGVGSRRAHLDSGAVEIDVDQPAVRQDVDELDDLTEVIRLGLGTHTARVVEGA